LCLLLGLVLVAGCGTRKIKKKAKEVVETPVTVSLTIRGDEPQVAVSLPMHLERLFKVQATLETVETGVKILKIIGIYAEVLEAVKWLLVQSLKLVANDETSRVILETAVALMK